MALSGESFISFMVLSFTFSLLCPSSSSQPTQQSATEAGWRGGPESGEVYVVAPTLEDCPNHTHCETLSYYAGNYRNKLSNVVFRFLPGTHNLSQTWIIKYSTNVTLLGGNGMTNSNEISGDMTQILCQKKFGYRGIIVKLSNFIVVENITIRYCTSALVFDFAGQTTVTNVLITHSFAGLRVYSCQLFTLTKSVFEYCVVGISLNGWLSSEISNSQLNNCSFRSIHCALNGGSITLNQITSDGGSIYGISFVQGHTAKATSRRLEKSRVNIANSRVILRKKNYDAILVYLRKDHPVHININSVSVTGAGGGTVGIYIASGSPDAGSKQNYATARIHNVSIEHFGVQLEQPNLISTGTPAAISVISLTSLTISDCTIKNNEVTGIFLFASTACFPSGQHHLDK